MNEIPVGRAKKTTIGDLARVVDSFLMARFYDSFTIDRIEVSYFTAETKQGKLMFEWTEGEASVRSHLESILRGSANPVNIYLVGKHQETINNPDGSQNIRFREIIIGLINPLPLESGDLWIALAFVKEEAAPFLKQLAAYLSDVLKIGPMQRKPPGVESKHEIDYLDEKIQKASQELIDDDLKPTDEAIADKLPKNPQTGASYTREWVNRRRKKLRKLGKDV